MTYLAASIFCGPYSDERKSALFSAMSNGTLWENGGYSWRVLSCEPSHGGLFFRVERDAESKDEAIDMLVKAAEQHLKWSSSGNPALRVALKALEKWHVVEEDKAA